MSPCTCHDLPLPFPGSLRPISCHNNAGGDVLETAMEAIGSLHTISPVIEVDTQTISELTNDSRQERRVSNMYYSLRRMQWCMPPPSDMSAWVYTQANTR